MGSKRSWASRWHWALELPSSFSTSHSRVWILSRAGKFLAILTEAVRVDGATAVVSSHIVTDIEAACDRLIVLGGGRKLLDATVLDAVSGHVVSDRAGAVDQGRVVASFLGPTGDALMLARRDGALMAEGERAATLEEVVIGFLTAGRSP